MDMENKEEKKNGGFRKGFLAGLLTAAILLAGVFGIRYVLGLAGGDYTGGLVSEKDVQDKLDKINSVISQYIFMKTRLTRKPSLKESTRDIRRRWAIRTQRIMTRSNPRVYEIHQRRIWRDRSHRIEKG